MHINEYIKTPNITNESLSLCIIETPFSYQGFVEDWHNGDSMGRIAGGSVFTGNDTQAA